MRATSTRIPRVEEITVIRALQNLKNTAMGPDEIPFWFWSEYALDVAPAITHIFNSSLSDHVVPDLWKLANVLPVMTSFIRF